MPRIEFKESNVKKNDYDYPKFKLDKKGEVARIAILEQPVAEFVHNLRKPKLVGGIAEKVTKETKDGKQYTDYKYEFVGRPICLGDYGILSENGSDPENCPICAEAKRTDRFYAPQRRFALHVLRYETRADGTVKEPFSARTEVYSFTDKVFSKLFSFTQEGFDLATHDILVKCENPDFAGYDFSISMKGEWVENDERKQYIKGLFQPENLAPDLAIFCGSKKTETGIGYDIRAINEAWDIAEGVQRPNATDAALSGVGSSALVGDLSSILDTPTKSVEEQWAPAETPQSAGSFEELMGTDSPAETEPVQATVSSDGDDIAALLKGL